jgi:hypothetical protein
MRHKMPDTGGCVTSVANTPGVAPSVPLLYGKPLKAELMLYCMRIAAEPADATPIKPLQLTAAQLCPTMLNFSTEVEIVRTCAAAGCDATGRRRELCRDLRLAIPPARVCELLGPPSVQALLMI